MDMQLFSAKEGVKVSGCYQFSKWENGIFSRITSRSLHKCHICQKDIRKGEYCYGTEYIKICITCFPQFCKNIINSMTQNLEFVKNILNDHNASKNEIYKNNMRFE